MAEPVSIDKFVIPKTLLQNVKVWAAIDKGCSLIKVLFVAKEEESDVPIGHVTLLCYTYLSDDFHEAIDKMVKDMKMPAEDPSSCTLRVTGAGCDKEVKLLREKTPFKVELEDEIHSQGWGQYWLLKNLDLEDICYPPVKMPSYVSNLLSNDFVLRMSEQLQIKEPTQESTGVFPCLLAFLGSGCGFVRIEANGEAKMVGAFLFGGRLLLSLGRLLVGTKNYKELVALAEQGDRRNIDTIADELFSNDKNSPYGNMDPETPIFHFGKAMNLDKNLEEFRKEDIAASLISCIASSVTGLISTTAHAQNVKHVFIGGNLSRAQLFRRELMVECILHLGPIQIRFIKSGHGGAIGAMLAEEFKQK